MKLYANVSSERASKGQGGNRFLEIELLAERLEGIPTRTNVYRLRLEVNDDNYLEATLLDYSSGQTQNLVTYRGEPYKKKGKKKEGEHVCYCGESELSIPHLNSDH